MEETVVHGGRDHGSDAANDVYRCRDRSRCHRNDCVCCVRVRRNPESRTCLLMGVRELRHCLSAEVVLLSDMESPLHVYMKVDGYDFV